MKSILVLSFYLCLLACISIISCQQGKGENTLKMDDEPYSLAWWFPAKDSINHQYVMVAEDIWIIGEGNDSTNVYDVDSLLMWQEECQKQLVACYNSISPNSQLTDAAKADSMLLELEKFFSEGTNDPTITGRIAVEDLLNSFNRYRCIAISNEILKVNKDFKAEMEAWENLQKTMKVFCSQVTEFKRSGDMPLSVVLMTGGIYQARINDLQRIRSIYKGEVSSNDVQKMDDGEVVERYASLVDEVVNSMKKELGEELLEQQDSLYDNVLRTQQLLKERMNKWVRIRKEALSEKANNDTAVFVEQLAAVLEEITINK